MSPRTLALFSRVDIAKFNKLLAHILQISDFLLVSKNFTKTSIPFKFIIWYLHCSSKVRFPSIFRTSPAISSSFVFKLNFILSLIPGINLIAEVLLSYPEATESAFNMCF